MSEEDEWTPRQAQTLRGVWDDLRGDDATRCMSPDGRGGWCGRKLAEHTVGQRRRCVARVSEAAREAFMSGVRYYRIDGDEEETDLYDVAKTVGIRFTRAEEPFLVAVDGDEVVGGVAVAQYADEWVFSVVVLPGYQGGGVGAELIRRTVAAARGEDVGRLVGDVVNDRLRPHLRKLGFRDVPGGRRVELVLS